MQMSSARLHNKIIFQQSGTIKPEKTKSHTGMDHSAVTADGKFEVPAYVKN